MHRTNSSHWILIATLLLFLPMAGYSLEGWKLEGGVGYSWGDRGGTPSLGLGVFHEAIAMVRPEFYDVGARVLWEPSLGSDSFRAAAGVRHKLYFVATSLLDQEVMVDSRWNSRELLLGLSGRFGGRWPLGASSNPYGGPSLEGHLVWFVGWPLAGGAMDQRLGFELGTSLGGPP